MQRDVTKAVSASRRGHWALWSLEMSCPRVVVLPRDVHQRQAWFPHPSKHYSCEKLRLKYPRTPSMVENFQSPRRIMPFCLLQLPLGPGQGCPSLQAFITSPPGRRCAGFLAICHAVSQGWLPPLQVTDDGVYRVLWALGGLTSLNKGNEYI